RAPCCATRCSNGARSTASWRACRASTARPGRVCGSSPRGRTPPADSSAIVALPMPRKMGQIHPLSRAGAERAADFRELLAPGAIRAVFQPIVRLSDLQPIGYEGLARFPTPPGLVALPPDVTLAAAARAGLRDDIEVACWRAIAAAGVPPHGRLLWVNLSPEALGHPGLLELAGKLPSRLVIELTEQDTVLNHA